MFTNVCAMLSRMLLGLAVILLIAVVLCVQWQVIGRYIYPAMPF